jgi:dipeptidyl aminopeptidase/acylaminoacyl peptidase
MIRSMHRVVGVVLAVVLLAGLALVMSSCGTRETKLIPRSVLFGNPERMRARLSPDGEKLAYVAPVDDVLNVWVRTVGDADDRVVTHDDQRGIVFYFWAQDSEHIMYIQDQDGDENWRLYAVSLATEEVQDLTPFEGVQVRVLDYSKHHPNTMIVAMNQQDPRLHDAYKLDLTTAELTMVARNPGNIVGWVTDFDLRILGAVAARPDGGMDLLVREDEEAMWDRLLTWGPEDTMTSSPYGFSKDGEVMYLVDSRDANAGRLVALDIESGEIDVIAGDPMYDVGDVMINPDTYEIEAVSFTRERQEWFVIDDSLDDEFELIRGLDRGEFRVVSRDSDDDTWLVAFIKDNGPISYYSIDRESGEATFVFDHRTDLGEYKLAEMEPISFTARDGLTIQGYVTYPVGKGRTNLPMVLNVHGGPWARDAWGYNPEAQWLANRGYVCLQVNFRGSTGYGKEFLNAGDKEWGGKMHDDLVDAVEWAVDEGFADPERLAIYGASYGGYAALVGATFTPDLFTCAVATMGPSNLVTFMQTVPPYWSTMLPIMHRRVGNPETEEEFLISRSPLFKVDEIEVPMLIAHGANDPRVKQAESEQIVQAMKDKGLDCEFLVFEDEGHGFMRPENRLEFYAATEEFLSKHLGGRSEETAE